MDLWPTIVDENARSALECGGLTPPSSSSVPAFRGGAKPPHSKVPAAQNDRLAGFSRNLLGVIFLILVCGVASAQAPGDDFLSPLGLAHFKDYSAHRVSSDNRFVFSNDDSKRIMPGETFVMADLAGPGLVTHIWVYP
jgi:hypothetical protein